jgi:hypothetical protein
MDYEQALDYAIERIETFARVQANREEKQEALAILFDSVGLDGSIRERLFEWLEDAFPFLEDDALLIGLLLGLFMFQHYADEYGFSELQSL